MKLITAYIHPSLKDSIAMALHLAQFHNMTFQDMSGLVKTFNTSTGLSALNSLDDSAEIKLSMMCHERDAITISEIIRNKVYTATGAKCWIRISDLADKNSPDPGKGAILKIC